MKRFLLLVLAAIGIFTLDAVSKHFVSLYLPEITRSTDNFPYGGIPLFKDWMGIDFSINHATNKGAAWGLFAYLQTYLVYLRIAVIGGILTYLLFVKSQFSRQFALTLVLTGALGNVVDYFIYGHVVDMFHFRFWGYTYPIFNIADSSIFCGVASLFFQSLFSRQKSNAPDASST